MTRQYRLRARNALGYGPYSNIVPPEPSVTGATFTIPATGLGDVSDFPLQLTEADLPAELWEGLSANGRNLHFSVGGSPISRQIAMLDRTEQRALIYLKVPTVAGASATEITATLGEDAANDSDVWPSGYKLAAPLGYFLPMGAADGYSWDPRPAQVSAAPFVDYGVMERGALAQAYGAKVQGVAAGGGKFYTTTDNGIQRWPAAWGAPEATNSDPNGDVSAAVDHCGDLDYHDGKLYIAMEQWTDCANNSAQTIGVFDASTLAYIEEIDVSARDVEISGLVVEPGENRITLCSYCGSVITLERYSLSGGSFIETVQLSGYSGTGNPQQAQGIARWGDHYYISYTDNGEAVLKVTLDGELVGAVWYRNYGDESPTIGVQGITFDDAGTCYLVESTDSSATILNLTQRNAPQPHSGGQDELLAYNMGALGDMRTGGHMAFWGTRTGPDQVGLISASNSTGSERRTIAIDDGDKLATWGTSGTSWLYPSPAIDPPDGTLFGAALEWVNGGNRELFYNGASVAGPSSAGNHLIVCQYLFIGSSEGTNNSEILTGTPHFVRYSANVQAADWIMLEHRNLTNGLGITSEATA